MLINIHGTLNSEENQIIFGYGDETNQKYTEIIEKNINKYMRNLKRQLYNLSDQYPQLVEILKKQENIDIYSIGHSFGLTDKSILKEILENKNVRNIKMYYYKDREGYRQLNDNIRRIVNNNTFQNILDYTKCSEIPQKQN